MSDKKKAKAGRPTRYKSEYALQAEKLCKLGATDVQLSDFFGVSEVTINAWKKAHPIFLKSLKAGKDFNDDDVEQSLYKRAIGGHEIIETTEESEGDKVTKTKTVTKIMQGSDTAAIFWLKNRRPDKWRAQPENEGLDDKPIQKIQIEVVGADSNA